MYIKVGWLEYQPFDKEGTLNLYFPLQPTCEGLSSSLERLIGEVARILRQKLSLMQTQAELIQSLSHRYFRSVVLDSPDLQDSPVSPDSPLA